MMASRSVNSNRSKRASASLIGSSTYSDTPRPLRRTARLSGLSRWPPQAPHSRNVRYRSSSSCTDQDPASYRRRRFGNTPSNPLPKGSVRPAPPRPRGAGGSASNSARRRIDEGPSSTSSRCFFDSRPNGTSGSSPQVLANVRTASRTNRRSPRAHGTTAPPSRDLDSSGTTSRGSKSVAAPRPWHAGQAPWGELNENARGVISGIEIPQDTQAKRLEKSWSPLSNVLTTTTSSARSSAT